MARFTPVLKNENSFSVANKYDDLLSSFNSVCKFLELQAINRKKVADLENEITFAKASRAITTLSTHINNINLACESIRTANLCLNRQHFIDTNECIEIPYDMQSETVQCLREVYGSSVECDKHEDGLVPGSNAEAAAALIRTVESNVSELENFQVLEPLGIRR